MSDARSTGSLDILAGSRLRKLRTAASLSQQGLATKLGLTFQQVQKYEKGANRMAGPRVYELSRMFNVPMDYFYAPAAKLAKRAKQSEAHS